MTATQEKTMLTRDEAADFLNVRPNTLAVWFSTGRYDLPVVRMGRTIRYRLGDLEAFIDRHTVTPGQAAD